MFRTGEIIIRLLRRLFNGGSLKLLIILPILEFYVQEKAFFYICPCYRSFLLTLLLADSFVISVLTFTNQPAGVDRLALAVGT